MMIMKNVNVAMCDVLDYNIPISLLYNSETEKFSLNISK